MHTEGKLTMSPDLRWIIGADGNRVASTGGALTRSLDENEANARRLVTCWNEHDDLVRERDELVKERDELIAWIRVCDDLLKEYAPKYDGCSTEKKVSEIIAKYRE